jgi:hemerythrin-like domain-containing protein
MDFARQVSRALHDEHRANLDLLGRLEHSLVRRGARGAAADPDFPRLAGALARHIEQDVGRHFDFEERELFPRLNDSGEGDIAALLKDEHDAIRAVTDELLPLARAAAAGTLDNAGYGALARGMVEMIERQVAHIQKETMGLLPMLDDLLDEETDRALAFAYASG